MAEYSRRTMKQYRWQWEFSNIFDKPQALSLRRMRWIVSKACEMYQVKSPTVYKKRNASASSYYIYNTVRPDLAGSIQLIPIHMNIASLLHEVAHAIFWQRYSTREEDDHGPTWLGIYVDLLDRFYVLPKHASKPSLTKWGLTFKRIVPPGTKKARKRKRSRAKKV